MILISDIHGCFKTLMALLKKCPDEEVIFLGDLVDRGPDSKSVVQFAMDHHIPTVMGNHDQMMVQGLKGGQVAGHDARSIWVDNGAFQTMESYSVGGGKANIPNEHIAWLANLPAFIERDGILLSHTGNGRDGIGDYEKFWTRNLTNIADGRYRVFGHTPGKYAVIEKEYANIDTGCAYPKYGVLTAFRWPQMELFQQENCE